jgi:hypothetical protein
MKGRKCSLILQLLVSFINLNFGALKYFYFINDPRINKEKMDKFLRESKERHSNRDYETFEIKAILGV